MAYELTINFRTAEALGLTIQQSLLLRVVSQALDLPAGSDVPRHSHGGPVVVTVMMGELA